MGIAPGTGRPAPGTESLGTIDPYFVAICQRLDDHREHTVPCVPLRRPSSGRSERPDDPSFPPCSCFTLLGPAVPTLDIRSAGSCYQLPRNVSRSRGPAGRILLSRRCRFPVSAHRNSVCTSGPSRRDRARCAPSSARIQADRHGRIGCGSRRRPSRPSRISGTSSRRSDCARTPESALAPSFRARPRPLLSPLTGRKRNRSGICPISLTCYYFFPWRPKLRPESGYGSGQKRNHSESGRPEIRAHLSESLSEMQVVFRHRIKIIICLLQYVMCSKRTKMQGRKAVAKSDPDGCAEAGRIVTMTKIAITTRLLTMQS